MRGMNPRQRQGLLLVVVAAVGLIAVFVLIANYVSSVSKQVGPKVSVLTLDQPLKAYTPVTESMLSSVSVPEKWAPSGAMTDASQALGLVSDVPLKPGTELEQGILTNPPSTSAGNREMAIDVDPETGVLEALTNGSLVDIIATYQGNGQGQRNSAQVIVAGAKVVAVGQESSQSGSGSVPVVFSLTPQQVLKVSYADSFAAKLRLSIVAPGTAQLADPAPYAPSS